MAIHPRHGSAQRYSSVGRWWRQGQWWIPVPWATPTDPVLDEARRTPIQLGGAAVRRFERRLAALRGIARFLLPPTAVAWVSAIAFNAYTHETASSAATPVFVLGGASLVLVGLSMLQVVRGRMSREATLGVDPDMVFALLVDLQAGVGSGGRHRSVRAVEPATSGGTKGLAKLTALGLPGEARWEMLEYEPPRRVVIFAWGKWIGIPTISLTTWWLEPKEGGTHVRCEQEWRSLGLGRVVALNVSTLGWQANRMLAWLKAEGRPG